MVSSGFRIGLRDASKPCSRIHWISPIHTETRASSAANGLISMPLTHSGPTGKPRGKAHLLALDVDAVLDVLELLQRQVEEVAGAAGRVEHAEASAAP